MRNRCAMALLVAGLLAGGCERSDLPQPMDAHMVEYATDSSSRAMIRGNLTVTFYATYIRVTDAGSTVIIPRERVVRVDTAVHGS